MEHHPKVEIHVTSGYSMELVERLRAGDLDCAVINQSFGQEDLQTRELVDEELVVALGASTPLPVPAPVPLHALAGLKLVLPSRRHGLRIAIDDVLRAHSMQVRPRLEVDDMSVTEVFLRRSDWISILPASLVQRGLQEGCLRVHPLAAPGISRRIICVRDPHTAPTTAELTFIEVLAEKLRALQDATVGHTTEESDEGVP